MSTWESGGWVPEQIPGEKGRKKEYDRIRFCGGNQNPFTHWVWNFASDLDIRT
jgi:hypothetical protein